MSPPLIRRDISMKLLRSWKIGSSKKARHLMAMMFLFTDLLKKSTRKGGIYPTAKIYPSTRVAQNFYCSKFLSMNFENLWISLLRVWILELLLCVYLQYKRITAKLLKAITTKYSPNNSTRTIPRGTEGRVVRLHCLQSLVCFRTKSLMVLGYTNDELMVPSILSGLRIPLLNMIREAKSLRNWK